ncbi:MAG: hypothetical protein ABI724_08255 [Betaproteobacteria bacterium]
MTNPSTPGDIGAPFSDRTRRDAGYSPFLPLLLLVISAVAWPAFQCYQLVSEKEVLSKLFGNQTRQFEDATKLRNSLDTLARETALLADKGNPGAKLIVGELARRGISINPGAPVGAPDKAAAKP